MLYGYISSFDADRPETPEEPELKFTTIINGTKRTVEYDEDGAFIVKLNGKIAERDITEEQWEGIECDVHNRLQPSWYDHGLLVSDDD
jgi:hypothetical protein